MLKLLIKIFITLGQYAKKKHALVSFSEQNLVDCDGKDYGCNGGWPANAFEYTLNGINRESVYPYRGRQQTCQYNSKKLGTKVNNWHYVIPTEDENAVQKAVAKIGPVSAVIDAGRYSFQFYSSGVYDEPSCSSTVHNHAIAIVGYGKLNGKDYWIVKNSWGTSWGQQGYILMSRNKNNQCGIAYRVAYPLI